MTYIESIKHTITWCSVFGASTQWVQDCRALLNRAYEGDMMAAMNLKEKVDAELKRIRAAHGKRMTVG